MMRHAAALRAMRGALEHRTGNVDVEGVVDAKVPAHHLTLCFGKYYRFMSGRTALFRCRQCSMLIAPNNSLDSDA